VCGVSGHSGSGKSVEVSVLGAKGRESSGRTYTAAGKTKFSAAAAPSIDLACSKFRLASRGKDRGSWMLAAKCKRLLFLEARGM
jgi:hypothetical protein